MAIGLPPGGYAYGIGGCSTGARMAASSFGASSIAKKPIARNGRARRRSRRTSGGCQTVAVEGNRRRPSTTEQNGKTA